MHTECTTFKPQVNMECTRCSLCSSLHSALCSLNGWLLFGSVSWLGRYEQYWNIIEVHISINDKQIIFMLSYSWHMFHVCFVNFIYDIFLDTFNSDFFLTPRFWFVCFFTFIPRINTSIYIYIFIYLFCLFI